MELSLNMYQSVAIAVFVYYLGEIIRKKMPVMQKYCIPSPVIGGVIFAVLALVLRSAGLLFLTFDTTLQTVMMMLFFTSVGFTASFKLLKKGGIQVVLFLIICSVLCALQDVVSVGIASGFGLNPLLGLCTGSIPLVGGHGTSGAFGPLLEGIGVTGATTVAIASATFGLVAGSAIGGPLARRLIERNHLEPSNEDANAYASIGDEDRIAEVPHFVAAISALFVAMGIGSIITSIFTSFGVNLPPYIGSMLAACIIRNLFDGIKKPLPTNEIDISGNVALYLYLTMAMMTLKLWELVDLAVPMLVMLFAQVILIAVFCYFVVFRFMGKSYDAAVMASGCVGFGMGATANAMANMKTVTNKYGPSPRSFFVVPLVGSLFIDFVNSGIITFFMNVFA